MLLTLLPGLRDLRVPLTVGYLWLLNLWLWFADDLPRTAAEARGVVAKVFELADLLGPAVTVAAVSFCAYLLGSVLQSFGALWTPLWVRRLLHREPSESRSARDEYERFLQNIRFRVHSGTKRLPPQDSDEVYSDLSRAMRADVDTLRPRLLVANQPLYAEYDRLASEGEFRVNVAPPLVALGMTAGASAGWWWLLVVAAVAGILMAQGLRRQTEAASVIQRAVLVGVIEHPAQALLLRFGQSVRPERPPAPPGQR